MTARLGRKSPRMLRPSTLALAVLTLAACGDDQVEVVPVAAVRGAPIDGSADVKTAARAARVEPAPAPDAALAAQPDAVPDASTGGTEQAAPSDPPAEGQDVADALDPEPTDVEAAPSVAGEGEEAPAEEVAPDAAETAADEAAVPERKPLVPDEEGVYHLAFSDLSLEGEDVDNIIDYLLFPDEFEEGEGFEFPDHLKALHGKEITISGYMIPGRIRKNMVKDFMLVRDLAGCCFGGAPNPDEWIDVVMVGEAEAEYLRYLPIKVRGKLTLIGEQDQEGYAVGVYRMQATWAGEED